MGTVDGGLGALEAAEPRTGGGAMARVRCSGDEGGKKAMPWVR